MTKEFTIQGTVLSKVPCEIERQRRAQEQNVPVETIPLTYGSIRIGVNIIRIDDSNYRVNRFDTEEFDEERFILEISYRYNLELQDGNVVDAHKVVDTINTGDILDITLDNTYTTRKHNIKIIRTGPGGKCIKSYFTKAWADSIIKSKRSSMLASKKISVTQCFSKLGEALNRTLVFS